MSNPAIGRTIQTAGSERLDGVLPCRVDSHVWGVVGEWDDPAPEQRCRCGAHFFRADTPAPAADSRSPEQRLRDQLASEAYAQFTRADIAAVLAELDAARASNPVERRRGIYIASRTRYAERWRALRDDGCPIVSSWIDEAGVGATLDWRELWDRCVAEASNAAALIVYAENDDKYLKGALVEMGAALGHGVPVFLVMGDRNVAGSAWHHRLVTECGSFEDALALAIVEGLGR